MLLITILLLMAVILTVLTVFVVGTIGAAGIVIFGDVIVCILVIAWLIKRLVKKKRK